ncbi:MAG: glutaredoxin [Erysipelothrix sp.]|nr:glutaredoxin [Erysipelothrix sp.]
MSKVQLLTQNRCPKCDQLKSFLEMGLRSKYANDIVEVKREEDQEGFMDLVSKHGLMQTPVLVFGDKVLTDVTPSKVTDFLKEVIG